MKSNLIAIETVDGSVLKLENENERLDLPNINTIVKNFAVRTVDKLSWLSHENTTVQDLKDTILAVFDDNLWQSLIHWEGKLGVFTVVDIDDVIRTNISDLFFISIMVVFLEHF